MTKVTIDTEKFFEDIKALADEICKEGNEFDVVELLAILNASRQAIIQLSGNVSMAKQFEEALLNQAAEEEEEDISSAFAVAVPKKAAKKKANK